MTFLGWVSLVGVLLLLMALSSAWVRRLPISTGIIYLLVGLILGPLGLGLLHLDAAAQAPWIERLTEIAVVFSLFIGGLRLRLPLRDPAWRAAFWLAGPAMVLCIVGVAAFAHWILGLDVWLSLLLGAILAPTDPVLASTVSVNDAADHDRLRYGLSGEAGLNDGSAFPFVVFALCWYEHDGAGAWIGTWFVHRLLWAVPVALILGFLVGKQVGRVAILLRSHHRDTEAPSDFLALALIALVYAGAEWIGAWGFLAVFAAGVGLRRAEMSVVKESPHPEVGHDVSHPPAEGLVSAAVADHELGEPAVAAGVLVAQTISFGATAERILEVLLVVAVGVAVGAYWDPRAIPLALVLFGIVRPLAVHLTLARSPTTRWQRWMIAAFGVRGIGSLYYLGYALVHGVAGGAARDLAALTLSVVALSIVLHGSAASPALARYERSLVGK